MVIVGCAFLAVFVLIFGPYWLLVLHPEGREERALRRRLKSRRAAVFSRSVLKAGEGLSSIRLLDAILARSQGVTAPLERLLAVSGLKTTIGTVVLACVMTGAFTVFLASQLTSSALFAIGLGCGAACLPVMYVRWAARKRLGTFEEQFPEAIDLIARGLRAGHALTTTLQMVAEEISDPVGGEFRLLFDQQNYGMSLTDALRGFAERVPIIDARFFVTALLTQREMGGNLSEVLDNLATVIRERFRVKRQVRVVSAHGRITGMVLLFLPPVLAVVLTVLSPSNMRLLLDDPIGIQMLTAGFVLQVLGVIIVRRIMNVEY
jgi:tight adherence protein B